MTQIHARPNLNGNSPADFKQTALAVSDMAGLITKLIAAISSNVTHGRNYQTMDDADARRTIDLTHISRLAEMEADLRELAMAIFDASEAHNLTHLPQRMRKAG